MAKTERLRWELVVTIPLADEVALLIFRLKWNDKV